MYRLCVLIAIIALTACNNRPGLAPVVELKWQPHNPNQTTYRIRRGDTLYAVAFRYDQDYRQLAAFNHLHSPYALAVGQVLRVRSGSGVQPRRHFVATRHGPVRAASLARNAPSFPGHPAGRRLVTGVGQNWLWPIKGRVATGFIPQQGKKGIDIAGKKGGTVCAASGGVVAYAGSGLSGYGNLIIIKHNNQLLTAYGNNSRNIVREGQRVKAGQIIAETGVIDRRFWGVHFEIRKAGKPVNPLSYLQAGQVR